MSDHGLQSEKPDILIGIDLGQTCSGVAYSLVQGNNTIHQIRKWPGVSYRNEDKVPTMLVYPTGSDRPSSWGFRAEVQAEKNEGDVREWFKTLLDPQNVEKNNAANPEDAVNHEDIRHWYRDFLTLLYDHIKQQLSAQLPNFEWSAARIEFLFSMPTTWSPRVVEMYRGIVSQAGFVGPLNAHHSVTMSLTEAEAAAVHTATEIAGVFKSGDILVVCDAGGGTTDHSALEVTETMVESLSLKQVDVVGGENIGSVAIDIDFEKLVRERLDIADKQESLGVDPAQAAWEMHKSKHFQNAKCEHGTPHETPQFSVPIPRLKAGYINEDVKIVDGEMCFDKEDLETLFERQVTKIFKLVDKQIRTLADRMPNVQVRHLVLSGGLGQSACVQRRFEEHYRHQTHQTNTEHIQVRIAPEPQMAVCKGLVADRLRKLKAGQSVLGWRCCRASYGFLYKELYDRKNPHHVGRMTGRDPADGHLYVPDCVDWFIKKGEPVTIGNPIVHKFRRKIRRGDSRKIFPSKVVVLYDEMDALPYQFEAGVERLCEVDADLALVDEKKFEAKHRRFWQSGEPHLIVEYQVRVIIGPADLQFELWFEDQKMSKENSIKVEWAPGTDPSTAVLAPPKRFEDDAYLVKEKKRNRLFHRNSHNERS